MGPTASGKSSLAETIANATDSIIINADAFQLYRGLDIGTAKPVKRNQYKLLDIRNPDEEFGVGEFVLLAADLLKSEFEQGKSVVLCGGTGLYIRALIEEYKDLMPSPSPELRAELCNVSLVEAVRKLTKLNPKGALNIDLFNEVRVKRALEKVMSDKDPIKFNVPPFVTNKIAIIPPSEVSSSKIEQRTQEMFQNGWVAEVKNLLNCGYGPGNPGFRALGYEAIAEYIQEDGNREVLIHRICSDTVRYAKRQRTWLRAEPNLVIHTCVNEATDALEHLWQK